MTPPIQFIPAGDDTAYIKFQSAEKPRKVARTIRIADVFPELSGPDLIIDVDNTGKIIGLEVLL